MTFSLSDFFPEWIMVRRFGGCVDALRYGLKTLWYTCSPRRGVGQGDCLGWDAIGR